MNRRNFLKQSALLSVGGIFVPTAFISSCRKESLFDNIGFNGKVLIIGAGVSGLYAGYVMKSQGMDFQILEASDNYGGRLGKLTGFANFPIDLGAQWLHGKNNILGDLVARTGTKIQLDDSDSVFWFNNQLVKDLPKSIDIFEGENLPDVSYMDHAFQRGLGEEYKNIVEFIAGDQGADASRLSVYYNNLEEENWNSGEDDFKFEETYFDLIDRHIADNVKDRIALNTPVVKIDYSQSEIVVTDGYGNVHLADKVIITVPITILKSQDIQFVPPLPQEKISAFNKIGMDAGMKVFLKFTHTFFHQNIAGGAICAAYADDSVGKTQSDHVLLAFVMGEQAEFLHSLGSDAAITAALLEELDQMYNGEATESFIASHVQNWFNQPYIRGAYSYSTIGMGNAREIAGRPVDKKIYFAGEAMNTNGHHQTVQGAIETAYRGVINLLQDIQK